MQIFADRIEFCWIHLRGIGSLENSLWGYDGQGIRVWLNALAIESPASPEEAPQCVKESVNIPLDFYPLCKCPHPAPIHSFLQFLIAVLMDKGIIIGAEHESATRTNLPFVMFRHATSVRGYSQLVLNNREHDLCSLTCSSITSCATTWNLDKYERLFNSPPTISILCFLLIVLRSFSILS